MYAHVTTYRLGTSEEVARDLSHAEEAGEAISDQSARTIASWWHSPGRGSEAITSLSHGRPFDTDALREEVAREVTDTADSDALLQWLESLEAHLSD